ncbi:MAG: hypothetical protein ACYC7F_03380 [Gemmatimonadaceae bacterium]
MTISRTTKHVARSMVLAALFASCTTLAAAQRARPAGPPVTTKGATQSSPKAAKGQATAQARRIEARQRKAVRNSEKLRNKEQRAALKRARDEPRALRRGIRLGPDERSALDRAHDRYFGEFTVLEAQARDAERAGQADPSVVARIEEIRQRERAEMRRILAAPELAQFDRNLAAYLARLP